MKCVLTVVLAGFVLVLAPHLAHAQQPGSAAYNTILVPALGGGDTVPQSGGGSWGAATTADSTAGQARKRDFYGWSLNAVSEERAGAVAMHECQSAGRQNCRVEFTFSNQCAAVASGPTGSTWTHRARSPRALRKEVLGTCEGDCSIVWEGCSGR
ncbi:DUF4189 domain-containing protein [Stenotrophomonas humi]